MDMDDVPELLLSPTGSHIGDKPLFPDPNIDPNALGEKRKQKRQRMGMGKLLVEFACDRMRVC